MKLLSLLYKLTKPLVFLLDAERMHNAGLVILKWASFLIKRRSFNTRISIFQKKISGQVGIAAGFDKTAKYYPGFSKLNFDFIELGTFTPAEQAGNAQPRLVRLVSQKALINKMGFNNPGIKDGLLNLLKNLEKVPEDFGIAISLGRGKLTPPEKSIEDYTSMLKFLALTHAEFCKKRLLYIAINVSSPNTPGLRLLQNAHGVRDLVKSCVKVSPAPILIKFAPDFSAEKEFMENVKAAMKAGASGVIVTNTTTDYKMLEKIPTSLLDFGGGISGQPLKENALNYLKVARKAMGNSGIIIASGGIMNPSDARDRLHMGADLVQVYTGLVYYGPSFARDFYR